MRTQDLSTPGRFRTVDVIRGFALFGILFANIPLHYDSSLHPPNSTLIDAAGADRLLYFLFQLLIERKFVTIFSILFGFGFYVQLQASTTHTAAFGTYFKRRMLVLLVIGTLHAYFIWNGDILRNYALCGLLLFLLKSCAAQTILRTALLFSIIVSTTTLLIYNAFELEQYHFDTSIFGTQFTVDSYSHYLWVNWRTDTFTNFLAATPLTMLFCFGNMLLGFYLGKIQFFQEPQKFLTARKGLLLGGFTFGIACSYLFIQMNRGTLEITPARLWLPFVIVSGLVLQSLACICLFIQWRQAPFARKVNSFFEPVGRMALSNYVFQSVCYVLLFAQWSGWLKLYGKLGVTDTFILCILLFAIQSSLSRWWLTRFEQGPLEALVKRWSAGKAWLSKERFA